MRKLWTVTAAAALIAALGFATGAIAANFVVNDDAAGDADEPAPCDAAPAEITIQGAIDAASAGDNILVCPGKYVEDLEIFKDDLTLVGLENGRPKIQGVRVNGAAFFPAAVPNIDLQANGVTIQGFKIQGPELGADEYSSGLVIDGINNAILWNRFKTASGSPGSVVIQTWALTNGSQGLQDISGLLIAYNRFKSKDGPGLGYEGIFINPQTNAAGAGNPVRILYNRFKGDLYRAVGIARPFTDVSGNEMKTDLGTSIVATFGGPIPLGIKLFGPDADNGRVIGNEIESDDTFARGITVQSEAGGNLLVLNKVSDSEDFDCLDESSGGGTAGTDNTWINNEGEISEPAGICADDDD